MTVHIEKKNTKYPSLFCCLCVCQYNSMMMEVLYFIDKPVTKYHINSFQLRDMPDVQLEPYPFLTVRNLKPYHSSEWSWRLNGREDWEQAHCFNKGPNTKYLRFIDQLVSVAISLYYISMVKAATGDIQKKGCNWVPVKFYIQNISSWWLHLLYGCSFQCKKTA